MKRVVLLAALAASCNPPDDAVEPAPDAAAELPPVEPRVFGNQQKLLPNVAGNSVFGHAIGLGGDRLVISGRLDGTQATQAGALYVFAKAGPVFNLEQKVFAGDPIAGLMLGKSVAISGHTMIAGGTGNGAGGPVDGAAYIFTRTGATWSQQQKLTVADAAPQARFGQTVQLEGETAVVGAPSDGAGSVYVFVRDRTTTWTQQQKLTSPDGAVGDRFGYYHAISGNTLIVGARGHASNAGAAYVFVRSGTTWSFQQKLTAGDAPANAQFGRAVALDGNTAVVGAWQAASAGAAYVFVRSGTTWSQQQKLTASDLQGGDEYGSAVAIRRDLAVIGSKKDDDNGGQSGSVYVYKRSGSTWTEDQKIKPADAAQVEDRFGQALDFNGVDLVIGAYLDDQVAPDAGAAYVFDQPPAEVVRNGSFETGDYAGWTLLDDVSPTAGTYGIATDQETIPQLGFPFDFANSLLVQISSPGFPRTYTATDGAFVAFHAQREVANHRMFQDVQVPACDAVLRWDMEYTNHGAFDPVDQFSAVHVRNPSTDEVLATLFKTDAATPTTVTPMTAFEAPLSGFAGQSIRIDFEHVVHNVHCDIAWDHIRIVCAGPAPQIAVAPSPHDFGNQRVGTTSANQTFTITNTGTADLVINSIATAPPFQVTPGALPATIAPGANRTFTGRFAPSTTGPANGTISIASNAAGSPTLVSVTGTGTVPAISVSPGSHDFGPRRVGIASPAQTFTITNTGTAPLTITSTTTTGPFSAGATSTTLAPSASQNVAVTFTPTVTGAASGSLVINHDAAGSPTTIALTGAGIAPAISVAPSPLSFGSQRVGTTSAPQTLTVSNPGSDTLVVLQITTTGPFSTPNTTFAVAPGASRDIAVTFTPGTVGAAAGSVVFAHDAAGGSTTVNATGTGIQPAISPSVTQLDFGDQRVGTTSATKTFLIENTGSDTLTVTSLTASLPFATSTALPIVLAPSATSAISVTFSPAAAGVANSSLSIASDAPTSPTAIALAGRGVEPAITVAPALDFGPVRVGTPASQLLTVTNDGTSDLTLTGVTMTAPYSNADTFPIVIAPGTSTNLTIGFTPTAAGVATDTLAIASDAGGANVSLTGLGVEPIAAIDTTPIDFGLQRVGVTSPSRTLVVTNSGTFPLTVSAVTTTAPFAVTTAPSFTLQPSASTTVEVTFTPSAEGLADQTLTIAHDAGAATVIPLAGTGTIAELEASPSTLTFGDIRVGTTSAVQPVTIRNLGLAPLSITAITPSASFTTSGLTLPRNVLPNASVTFEVVFTPTAAGSVNGSVEIVTSGGSSTVMLGATAVTAALTADLASLDLGSVALGEASAAQVVTLTNVTDAPITVAGAVASDPQFVLDPPPSPAPIPPGGTVAFGVRFVPAAAGAATGQIDVTLDGSTVTEVSVQLAGQGLAEEGGCCSTGGSGASSSALLGLAVIGTLRRRRRR